jgi:hypothetical protein
MSVEDFIFDWNCAVRVLLLSCDDSSWARLQYLSALRVACLMNCCYGESGNQRSCLILISMPAYCWR